MQMFTAQLDPAHQYDPSSPVLTIPFTQKPPATDRPADMTSDMRSVCGMFERKSRNNDLRSFKAELLL